MSLRERGPSSPSRRAQTRASSSRPPDELGRVGGQDLGLRERDRVDRGHDHGRREGREGQIGGAEALAEEIGPPVGAQLGDPVELAPHGRFVLELAPGPDAEHARDRSGERRPQDSRGAVLPRGHASVVEALRELAPAPDHVRVDEPARARAKLPVEARADTRELLAPAVDRSEQAPVLGRTLVDPSEDL